MAGLLKRDSRYSLEESLDLPEKTEVCFNFRSENNGDEKVRGLFDEFLKDFLKEVNGNSRLRPLPPVIGEGEAVDLLKLHIVVRKRGGFRSVSRNGLWSSVAADCGLDLRISAALKLVYVKYLGKVGRWLRKIDKDKDKDDEQIGINKKFLGFIRFLMDLESNWNDFLSGSPNKVKKNAVGSVDGDMSSVKLNVDVGEKDRDNVNVNEGGNGDNLPMEEEFVSWKSKRSVDGDMRSVKLNVDVSEKDRDNVNVNEGGNGDNLPMEEESVSRKRKRECYMGMLNWIVHIAKDPCNPDIEPLPDCQKWKNYGSELQWKQILLAREAMLLKKNVDGGSQQSVWQKKQKMHPSMYDDDQSGSERLRYSQRLISAKDSSRKSLERVGSETSSSGYRSDEEFAEKQSGSTTDSATFLGKRKKRIPIGPPFQAELPEFSRADYESDAKWLGTKIWPLYKTETNKSLIERDPIGKGRQDSCGCQFQGSIECVRFHVKEKRMKLKLELGSAFYISKFDRIGEDVAFSWTKEDEYKFQHTVESNRLSADKCFWDELFKIFPKKGREALVSYYFNVFLLRRRGHQNRSSTSNIESDDEESEFGPIANRFGQLAAKGSIFCSPKKSHLNSR